MTETIKIIAQVGDNPPTLLGESVLTDDGVSTLRATAELLRKLAGSFDDITTLHELNLELDRRTR